jgi:hypothetical protein
MLTTPTVTQLRTPAPNVYAFEVRGGTRHEDLAAMAQAVNEAFDRGERIALLIRLVGFDGIDAAAGLSGPAVESGIRSLGGVERYAVIGPPRIARVMIETFGRIIPTEARTFASAEESEAWAFVLPSRSARP